MRIRESWPDCRGSVLGRLLGYSRLRPPISLSCFTRLFSLQQAVSLSRLVSLIRLFRSAGCFAQLTVPRGRPPPLSAAASSPLRHGPPGSPAQWAPAWRKAPEQRSAPLLTRAVPRQRSARPRSPPAISASNLHGQIRATDRRDGDPRWIGVAELRTGICTWGPDHRVAVTW